MGPVERESGCCIAVLTVKRQIDIKVLSILLWNIIKFINPLTTNSHPRSPRTTISWLPETSYIVPISEKDGLPHASEGMRTQLTASNETLLFRKGVKTCSSKKRMVLHNPSRDFSHPPPSVKLLWNTVPWPPVQEPIGRAGSGAVTGRKGCADPTTPECAVEDKIEASCCSQCHSLRLLPGESVIGVPQRS